MSSQISSIVSKVQDNVDQIDDSVMSLHDLYTKLYVIHHTEDHSLLDHKHQQLKEILTEEDITQELLDELLTSVQADNISNILQKSNTISEDQPHETTAPQTAQPTATTS